MKKLATIVTMFLFASIASAQDATMKPKLHEVKQGDVIPFSITVKPAPNVGGSLNIVVKSDTSEKQTSGGGSLGANQNSIDPINVTIPIDATIGKWTVAQVIFNPGPGGKAKSLNLADMPSFVVTERQTVEPDSAVVEVK